METVNGVVSLILEVKHRQILLRKKYAIHAYFRLGQVMYRLEELRMVRMPVGLVSTGVEHSTGDEKHLHSHFLVNYMGRGGYKEIKGGTHPFPFYLQYSNNHQNSVTL